MIGGQHSKGAGSGNAGGLFSWVNGQSVMHSDSTSVDPDQSMNYFSTDNDKAIKTCLAREF
jgi:hypothetical protein